MILIKTQTKNQMDNISGIMDTILRIATEGAACGDRRREDIFRSVS